MRPKTSSDKPPLPFDERRREPRESGGGEVLLTRTVPIASVIVGRLIDRSESGFRVEHSDATLESGQTVLFRHSYGSGRATVMWNRISGEAVESGFLIVGR
jgi:hypothetical protein